MLLSVLKIAVTSIAVFFAIAIVLVLSQRSTVRKSAAGLDFSRQIARTTQAPETMTYAAPDGAALDYRRFDSGKQNAPLAVLVHGSGWHGLAMVSLAQHLSDTGAADAVVPDLRGHGRTPQRRGDIDYIGQFEDDLHALIEQERRPGQPVVMIGHSSGGGLTVRYAGGPHGQDLDGAVLLAPFLKHNAPTTRPNSGGWARPLTRRIIGLSMLNTVGITALNHLPILDFAFPSQVLDGPLGDTATLHYSYRLNTSFAPRPDYLADVARLPPFLLIAGRQDEAFIADQYEPTMSPANANGTYLVLDGVSHLDVLYDERALKAVADHVSHLPPTQRQPDKGNE